MIKDLLEEEIKEENRDMVKETPYQFNGYFVPRVTEILSSMLHEDYLMGWSNYLGFKKQKYADVLKEAANKGTFVHNSIEHYLKENKEPQFELTVPDNLLNEVETAYNSFLSWWNIISKQDYKILMQEQPLVSPWFGGTLDLLIQINGRIYLMDFKTSNQVSYKYFLQLAAYRYMLKEQFNINVDGVGIILFNKKEVRFSEYILDFNNPWDLDYINTCLNTFFGLVYSYYGRLKCESMFKEVKLKSENGGKENEDE